MELFARGCVRAARKHASPHAYLEAMNKDELTKRVARESHRSRAEAADFVDKLVYRLLKDLKRPPATTRKDLSKAAPKAKP
jgi:hypothetical protein